MSWLARERAFLAAVLVLVAGPAFAADDLIPCLPRAIAECLR